MEDTAAADFLRRMTWTILRILRHRDTVYRVQFVRACIFQKPVINLAAGHIQPATVPCTPDEMSDYAHRPGGALKFKGEGEKCVIRYFPLFSYLCSQLATCFLGSRYSNTDSNDPAGRRRRSPTRHLSAPRSMPKCRSRKLRRPARGMWNSKLKAVGPSTGGR